MRHILLYWNHICVLHRQEKTFLDALAQRLLSDEIQLEVRYFPSICQSILLARMLFYRI